MGRDQTLRVHLGMTAPSLSGFFFGRSKMSEITDPETLHEHTAEPKPSTSQQSESADNRGARQDRGRLHAVRNSVLNRGLLESLRRYGENPKVLRRMETELRAALRPTGPIGNLLFGRFWACVLRLILVARLEGTGLAPRNPSKNLAAVPSLREGALPILVTPEPENLCAVAENAEAVDPDVFHRLALIARYDRAASREMYKTLGLLLLMRDFGEKGLAEGVRAAAGIKTLDGERGEDG